MATAVVFWPDDPTMVDKPEIPQHESKEKAGFIGPVPPSPDLDGLIQSLRVREAIPDQLDDRVTRYRDGTVDKNAAIALSRSLHRPNAADLEAVAGILGEFRFIYEANPVGSENQEIILQLLGENPKKVVFIDPELPALNSSLELTDRWGSPFIFHPVSATQMGLRSKGPDGILWTEDDLELE